MFNTIIKETTNLTFLSNENSTFYIRDKNAIYSRSVKEVIAIKPEQSPYFFDGTFWFGDYHKGITTKVDEKGREVCLPYFLSDKTKIIKNRIYNIRGYGKKGLEMYSSSNKLLKSISGRFSFLTNSADLLYVMKTGMIIAYNFELEEVWSVHTDKRCFPRAPVSIKAPRYYEPSNLLIVNLGEIKEWPHGEFEINAYNASTGEVVWQNIVCTTPDYAQLTGDRVYLCVKDEIIILDAATGEYLLREKHELNGVNASYFHATFVYPYTDKLLVASPQHQVVQLRTGDAKTVIQEIQIPIPYNISCHPPVIHEDKVYFSLGHLDSYDNTMKGAVLILTPAECKNKQVEAKIEPRPPIQIKLANTELGNKVYQVTIEHDDLDEIIRFSTITLKEIAFKYGKYPSTTETNRNHNGNLQLFVKANVLNMTETDLLEALSIIKFRVEENLSSTDVRAGDGKNDFTVDIQLV